MGKTSEIRQVSLALLPAIFFIGLLTLQAQVLLFRELLVSSQGNELALGSLFVVWLTATGLGSFLGGSPSRKPLLEHHWGFIPLGMAVLLLAALVSLRILPPLLGHRVGESLSLLLWTFLVLISLFPFCILSGLLFPLFSYQVHRHSKPSTLSVARVYLGEALGAATGGLLGLVLIHFIEGLMLALWLGAGLAGCSFLIMKTDPALHPGKGKPLIPLFAALAILGILLTSGKEWDQKTRAWQWQPYSLKLMRETPLGSLILAEREGQLNFFMNGLYQFSTPDPRRAEEKTHLPLLIHPAPQRIFLIGGGLSGTLREILKHPTVKEITVVELDKHWVKTAGMFLPDLVPLLQSHPKVQVRYGDARQILNRTRNSYDLILLDLAGPATLQLNRFYTREFFRTAKAHLRPGGLLAFTMTGATDMVGDTQLDLMKILYDTLGSVFPGTRILSGEEIHLLGFRDPLHSRLDPSVLVARIKERGLTLGYLTPLEIQTLFSPWRSAYFQKILDPGSSRLRINHDLTPVGFFNQTLYDLAHRHPGWAGRFQDLKKITWPYWILFLMVLYLSLHLRHRLSSSKAPFLPVLTAVGVAGFSGLALEILILILFQVFLGYLYLEIGFLIAFFMLGLAGGSFLPAGKARENTSIRWTTIGFQGLMGLLPVFILCLIKFSGIGPGLPQWALKAGLYCLMALAGLIGGAHYILCTRAVLTTGLGLERAAGRLYGIDLFGAALGSVLTTFFFLPLWGIETTLLFLFLLNLMAAILLFFWKYWGIKQAPLKA